MSNPKVKIVTIRPADEQERDDIRYVMRESGYGHASQAMLFACRAYRTMNERNKPLIEELQTKHNENNRRQQKVIHDLQTENLRLHKRLNEIQKQLAGILDMMKNIQEEK